MGAWRSRTFTARTTRPCRWCGRPLKQRLGGLLGPMYCNQLHWLRYLRENFVRNLFP